MKRADTGFTIVELLTVVGIVAILIGLLLPVLSKVREHSRVTKTKALIGVISSALEDYRLDWGVYPDVTGIALAPASPSGAEARASCRILYFCLTTPFRQGVTVASPTGGPGAGITASKTAGPYMELKSEDRGSGSGTPWINDAFHNPLAYNYNSDYNPATTPPSHNTESFDIWSFGPDEATGTSDDVTNW